MSLPKIEIGKLALAFIGIAALLFALTACTQVGQVNALPAAAEDVSGATPTPFFLVATPTPTPRVTVQPTPTPLAEKAPVPSFAAAATSVPIPTPTPTTPTATPQPTASPLPEPIATPSPRTPAEDSIPLDLGGGVVLYVSPENAVAGRNVTFLLSGLDPWEPVTVSFSDPDDTLASWITSEDVHLIDASDVRATSRLMYPDASGELYWERYAAQDAIGTWTMDINFVGGLYQTTYSLDSLELRDFEQVLLGTLLTRRPTQKFVIYYSELVPTALVVDLQDHLSETAQILDRNLQTETKQIPDIYLTGNRELLDKVSTFTGLDPGFEDGYYTNFGERPGIFMRTDLMGTEVRRLLTHEYVHHVFESLSNNQTQPAWLTEGLSEYYEFDIATSGPRPGASELRQYTAADLARAAAQDGTLFSLAALDSQSDWNSRIGDGVALQYSQAYMAARFLIETYGPLTGKDLVVEIGRGTDVSDALNTVTGLNLSLFELQFHRWLANWDDPEREAIAEYFTGLEVILEQETANSNQRAVNIGTSMNYEESVSSRAALVRSTEGLIEALNSLSPPERGRALHQEINDHFNRVLVWLSLELLAAENLDNGPLITANNIIPEINARDFNLKRNLSNLKFVLNLP